MKSHRLPSLVWIASSLAAAAALLVCLTGFAILSTVERRILEKSALDLELLVLENAHQSFRNFYNVGDWVHLEELQRAMHQNENILYSYIVDESGKILLAPDGFKSKHVGMLRLPGEPETIVYNGEFQRIAFELSSDADKKMFSKEVLNKNVVLVARPIYCVEPKKPCGQIRHLIGFNSTQRVLDALFNRLLIIAFVAAFAIGALVYWVVLRFLKPLNILAKDLEKISSQTFNLIDAKKQLNRAENEYQKIKTREISLLMRSLSNFTNQMQQNHEIRERLESTKAVENLAKRVLHDIRSPLSVLEMWNQNVLGLRDDDRKILTGALRRVRDIANSLAKVKSLDEAKEANESLGQTCLQSVVIQIVEEKKLEYRSISDITIEADALINDGGLIYVEGHPAEIKRVLSNILNNSVEARTGKLQIRIALAVTEQDIVLTVSDNGRGIPAEVIALIMNEGGSFDKPQGSGLGLSQAKEIMSANHGSMEILSILNEGTIVRLNFRAAGIPHWIVTKLNVHENTKIFIVDDDAFIHSLWKDVLVESGVNASNIFSAYNFPDFLAIQEKVKDADNHLYLFDHDIPGEAMSGLDFVIKNEMTSRSYIVTHRHDDDELVKRMNALRIKLIPKNALSKIEIIFAKHLSPRKVVVLIDDELIIRESWRMTLKRKGIECFVCSSNSEFLAECHRFDKASHIFVDLNISGFQDGIDVAKNIFQSGFTNIHFCTGFEADEVPKLDFIRSVNSKEPPAWLFE